MQLVGEAVDRVDGRLKVTGAARYTAEFSLPGLVYGVLVQSTIAKGQITSIDARAAEAAPGVLAVITHQHTPRLAEAHTPPVGQSLPTLQDDVVQYSGQHVALVVADTLERAEYAATLVEVAYEEEPPIATFEAGLARAFSAGDSDVVRGNPAEGLAQAEVRIEQTYTTPMKHHNPMEPGATIASWEGDRLTLYDATQCISITQEAVAQRLGMRRDNVRVMTQFVGGGFGCKGWSWPHTTLAALAARHVGRPVKLVLTRAQMYTAHGYQTGTVQQLVLGATRAGQLTVLEHQSTNQTSAFDDHVEGAASASLELYACPNVVARERIVRVNATTPTAMRAPGAGLGMFALECGLDELAYALGLDPLELRLRNYAAVDPQTGRPWSSNFLRECYQAGAERFGWARRSPEARSMRAGDGLIGWGMASTTHPEYRGEASARVCVLPDGQALVQSGTQDIGTGTYTALSQIAADVLGLRMDQVVVELGDTDLPTAPGSIGSRTITSVGPAVHEAAAKARSRVIRMALGDERSPLHGYGEEHVVVENGGLRLAHQPSRGETYVELLSRHGVSVEAMAQSAPGPEQDGFTRRAFGAVFVEVHVDPSSGQVRVSRCVGAYDGGRIVNPRTARSQMIGGIVFGIGMALMEHTVVDPRLGRILTPNLSGYLVPTHADVPEPEVLFVGEPDPHTSALGTKGIGELPAIGVPAAIANAVYHATGCRVRDLPITPAQLL